ncbi:ZIP family metal transporter [Paenactinomyces guangxiensis]|uniref:ZIP family metal transporter n=1 Tax=Paenactinomyces guangxiensis TaxID=1490290 RepID=A0A7W2A8U3_9BACL|nr:ZIP family metal transporter [Paenactinomyces guangxiensis]MBA4495946.1 ZIP family metal transporter [Paenactinomyces guangxiensis]MBH8593067.1 ZIP family metal transporter [Paenactinomyces guangxiensis]
MVSSLPEAVIYSAWTGASILLGTILVLFFSPTRKTVAFSLGMSGGVMLFVCYLTLLPSAFKHGGFLHLLTGMGTGTLLMLLLHHLPFSKVGSKGESSHLTRLGFLLVIAVAAHNAPEGAALGIGFKTGDHVGHTLALAMAVHNIPEGIGLAAPLVAAGRHPLLIVFLSLLCGATLPLGTWIGLKYLTGSPDIVSAGLIFAAVTMIWVVICEICPRAFTLHKPIAWVGMGFGALFMYIIHLFH